MGRLRTYECPACDSKFEVYCHRTDEAAPRFCPTCGYDTLKQDISLAAPYLATGAAKNADGVVRAMEEGADWRARKAAESFGATTAEANGLKLTNLRDNARAGETAAIPVVNDVTRHMAATADLQGAPAMGHVGAEQAIQYSGQVTTGPTPNAGARAANALRNLHAGQGNVVTNTPALETMSPLYQRRT